jgi:hypothetical protein
MPQTGKGVPLPTGLLPSLENLHALAHLLAQTWTQIGRSPAALGNIAPNIGSVVAIEKEAERQPVQVFPTFLALNSGVSGVNLPASFAPFRVIPNTAGIANTTNPYGRARPRHAGT